MLFTEPIESMGKQIVRIFLMGLLVAYGRDLSCKSGKGCVTLRLKSDIYFFAGRQHPFILEAAKLLQLIQQDNFLFRCQGIAVFLVKPRHQILVFVR